MNKKLLYSIVLIGLGPFLRAEINDGIRLGEVIEEDRRELYNVPNVKVDFQKTPLHEVINVLAMASGLNYQMDAMDLEKISMRVRMNPFKALELMSERNGLSLSNKEALWFISKYDENERISKTYSFKNTHLSSILKSKQSGPEGSGNDEKGEGTQASALMRSVGTSFGDRSNAEAVVAEIKKILEVGSETSEARDDFVSYDPDTNALYVIASGRQHGFVENFLQTIDQEVPNIEMKIMFLASNDNPERQFGVDWSGVLKEGYDLSISGMDSDGSQWGSSLKKIGLPTTAILSTKMFNLKLNALDQRSTSETKRYPLLTGYSNREVIVNFTKNEPVVSMTTATEVTANTSAVGTGTTNMVDIKQEEIGTVVKLLPRVIEGGKLSMDIDIGVSNILGFKTIQGNDYPIISQTRYQGQTKVESGYTIVIGGLEETIAENTEQGVRFFKNIPFFGWLFKDIKKGNKKQKLSLYISVRLLNAKGEEVFIEAEDVAAKEAIQGALAKLTRDVQLIEKDLRS